MSEFQFVKLCACGCGEPTRVAERTNDKYGHSKGQPVRFLPGHQSKTRPRRASGGTCAIDGCTKKAKTKGWCAMHYWRWANRGSVDWQPPQPPSVESRFWSRVEKTESCWLWRGTILNTGYGVISVNSRHVSTHRLSYEWANGPIPEGLVIDHLCRVTACCNPSHLEAVTNEENFRRGASHPAVTRRIGRCARGHRLAGANVYSPPGSPNRRTCKECMRLRGRAWRRKQRAS